MRDIELILKYERACDNCELTHAKPRLEVAHLRRLVELARLATPPVDDVRDCIPLVLFWATKEDADEFKAIVLEAKPGLIAKTVER